MSQAAQQKPRTRSRANWERQLHRLAEDVSTWSKAHGWAVERFANAVSEEDLGTYASPTLHIHTGAGTLVLEPVAKNIVAGDGRVDLYSLKTFRRLLLIERGGRWQLYTEDRVRWPEPWSEAAFVKVAESLTAA